MAFCTPEELVAAHVAGRVIHTYELRYDYYAEREQHQIVRYEGQVDLDVAREIIAKCKEATHAHRQHKINRPYVLVPEVTDNLDPNDDWIGWEIECGWEDQENYDRAVNYVWNEQNHVTIDIEGAGLPTEITWSPENGASMYAGDAQVHRFLDWVATSGVRPAEWNEHSRVGTHCNISTPAFRAVRDADKRWNAVVLVNEMLHALTDEEKHELFGRGTPYGYGHSQSSGGGKVWVEFKLFNSTLDRARFDGYVRVAERLGRLIDHVLERGKDSESAVVIPPTHPVVKEAYDQRMDYLRRLCGFTLREAERYAGDERDHAIVLSTNVADFLRGKADRMISVSAPGLVYTTDQRAALMKEAEAITNSTNQ